MLKLNGEKKLKITEKIIRKHGVAWEVAGAN